MSAYYELQKYRAETAERAAAANAAQAAAKKAKQPPPAPVVVTPPPQAAPPIVRSPNAPSVVGPPLSVQITTNPDKVVVRRQIAGAPEGEYFQEFLTIDQAKAIGWKPEPKQEEALEFNRIRDIAGVDEAARQARVTAENATLKDYADELDISQKSFKETVERFKENPESPEFKTAAEGGTITLDQKRILALAANKPFSPSAEFQKTHIRIGIETGGEPDYITVEDAEQLKESDPDLYRTLITKGRDAYNAEVRYKQETSQDIQNKAERDYETSVKEFETALKEQPQILQDAYKEGGYDAYEVALDNYNADIERKTESYNTAVSKLAEYEDGDKYDIAGYLRDHPSQEDAGILLQAGFSKETITETRKYNVALADISKYKTADGYDLAKYLRNNPGQEQKIIDAGWGTEEIAEAQKFNYEYLGVGVPERIDRDKFIADYYKEKGWKFDLQSIIAPNALGAVAGVLKPTPNFKPYQEANEAYNKIYAPPMSLAEFQRNYFDDKDWPIVEDIKGTNGRILGVDEYTFRKTLLSPESAHKAEATKEYIKKFGYEPIVQQVVENVFDMAVPGYYVSTNWNNLSTPAKAINIAIDVVFIGMLFGKPLVGVTRAAYRTISRELGGAGVEVLDKLSSRLARGIAANDRVVVRAEARNMVKLGEEMQARGIAGGDSLIARGNNIIKNAENIAIINRSPSKTLKQAIKRVVDDAEGLSKREGGFLEIEKRQGRPEPKLHEGPRVGEKYRVGEYTVSRKEAETLARETGVSLDDIEQALRRVGNDKARLAEEIRKLKNNRDFEKILKDINKAGKEKRDIDFEKILRDINKAGEETKARADLIKRLKRLEQEKQKIQEARLLRKLEESKRRLQGEPVKEKAKLTQSEKAKIEAENRQKLKEQMQSIKEQQKEWYKQDRIEDDTLRQEARIKRRLEESKARQERVKLAQEKARRQAAVRISTKPSTLRPLPEQGRMPSLAPGQAVAPMVKPLISYPSREGQREFAERVLATEVHRGYVRSAEEEAESETDVKYKTELEEQAATRTRTKTIPATRTQTITRTSPITETRAAILPKIKPEIKPQDTPKEAPKDTPKPTPKPKPPKLSTPKKPPPKEPDESNKRLRLKLPGGSSDKEKRQAVLNAEGAIAWRQGQLGGKDVWHCIKYPYASETDCLTVLGKKPSNTTIVRGPASAYQTIKLRHGQPPASKVTGDMGFMDFFIEPKTGRRVGIGFKPDPKMETTGDITIGISRRTPPITERPPRLSGTKGPRITPKRPVLRR